MAKQPKKPNPRKGSQPKKLDTQGPGEDALTDAANAYAGFVGRFREQWLDAHESDLPAEDNSRCPFCGWDCREARGDGQECPHLLTELLCDWDDFSPEGTAGGAFENVARASFKSLNQAVSTFLRSSKGDKKRVASLTPARVRCLVQTVAEGAQIAGGDVERSFKADTEAFGQYIADVCSVARVEVRRTHYDTGDPYGTSPHVFWAADAAKAATKMARLVAKDAERLKVKAKGISPSPRGTKRRPLKTTKRSDGSRTAEPLDGL